MRKLEALAIENVMVEKENHLVLSNNGNQTIKLRVSIVGVKRRKQQKKAVYKSFTRENKSAKSTPLNIPNAANPNLSPFSKSAVNLKIGQEIVFRTGHKKYILLKVD